MFRPYSIDKHGIKNWSPWFPLILAIILLLIIISVSSMMLHIYEQKSYADCLWLAFMGSSTVGFGAVVPLTIEGRIIVGLTASLGICTFGAIGTFSAMLAFSFTETEIENRELMAQNAEIIRTNLVSNAQNAEIIRTNLISNKQNAEIDRTNQIAIEGNTNIEEKLDELLSRRPSCYRTGG